MLGTSTEDSEIHMTISIVSLSVWVQPLNNGDKLLLLLMTLTRYQYSRLSLMVKVWMTIRYDIWLNKHPVSDYHLLVNELSIIDNLQITVPYLVLFLKDNSTSTLVNLVWCLTKLHGAN